MKHSSLTSTWVKLGERPEKNSEPAYFVTFMNNGKIFPSLGGMQLPLSRTSSASTTALASQKVLDILRPSETLFIRK